MARKSKYAANRTKRRDNIKVKPEQAGFVVRGGGYWLYGVHAVQAALENKQREKHRLLATENGLAKLQNIPNRVERVAVQGAQLSALLGEDATHQGVALEVMPLSAHSLEAVVEVGKPLMMLDQVTDPHNIGAILRTAAAFDAGAVIVQDKNAPKENATMAKIAAGGLEVVPLVSVTNLSRAIEELQEAGYWAVGMDGAATEELGALSLSAKTVIVMGAEGKGMRRLVAEKCDQLAKLPIHAQMESLNVSVAAGIALYEVAKSE